MAAARAKAVKNSMYVHVFYPLASMRPRVVHRKFEDLAVGVLSMCQASSSRRTFMLLHEQLDMFTDRYTKRNSIDVAFESQNLRFLGNEATQMVINTDWYGELLTATQWWKVVVVILCPILVPILTFLEDIEVSCCPLLLLLFFDVCDLGH